VVDHPITKLSGLNEADETQQAQSSSQKQYTEQLYGQQIFSGLSFKTKSIH
jgi:hypothetical protein